MKRFPASLLVFSLLAVATIHASEDGDGHHHEEEEVSASVGPDKGITELDEHEGFKLSKEALENFDLKSVPLSGRSPWTVAKSALVLSGEEMSVFRRRNDFFMRIDFRLIKAAGDRMTIASDELRTGDAIVVSGLGFLRIAELAATGGVAHGHSH